LLLFPIHKERHTKARQTSRYKKVTQGSGFGSLLDSEFAFWVKKKNHFLSQTKKKLQ
jgi:hypothetical protein